MSTRQLGPAPVKRRHVFFVPGYDPNAPRRYRELYRREAAKQAEICGYEAEVSAFDVGSGSYGWRVDATFGDKDVQTTFEFLTWQDIVRASMARSLPMTYWAMIRTVWVYASTGALWRLIRLRPAPMLAAVYPVAALLLQLCIAILMAWVVFRLGASALPGAFAALLGFVAGWLCLRGFLAIDHKTFVHYLMHDFAFTSGEYGRWPDALQARIATFAERICEVRDAGEADEVLIVGHSSGAQIGVAALAQHLSSSSSSRTVPIGLLTLGQVIPMVSFLPSATDLRTDLRDLSGRSDLTWIDISAPGDGGCFALTDPVAASGVAPHDRQQYWPKVISAAYGKTMSAAWRKQTRRQFFRRHFQYLCAFDYPGDFDYFAITAGPKTLSARFAGRGSSASMITRPLSGYRDCQ